jgi:hypothetical protein
METTRRPLAGGSSARILVLCLSIAMLMTLALPAALVAQDEATDEMSSDQAICETADNLRLVVGFLQDTSISEDGVIPVVIGGIAGVSQARELADLVGDTLRPLVEDVIVSMQGLRDIGDEMTDEQTLGAKVAVIGESVVEIGESMDALGLQLRERCPDTE